MCKSRISCSLPWAVLCVLLSTTGLQAASSLIFPRISSEPETLTGLAISNLSAETATVTLTAYGTDGTVLTGPGFTNPATLTIPAHEQAARLLPEIFAGSLPTSAVAWVHLTSPTDGLTGFFLILDGTLTELDGADLPEAGPQIVFNTVQVDEGFTTELNLINTTALDTVATLTLVRPGDDPDVVEDLSLAAHAVARLDAGSYFGLNSIPPGSYLRVTADGTALAGFEFVKATDGDLLGLNARKATEKLDSLSFPQMVVSGPWTTELGLVNYSTEPVLITAYAHRPDGSLYGGEDLASNPVSRGLNPGEGVVLDIGELFGFTDGDAREGWLEVTSSAKAINGFLSYGIPTTGYLAAIAPTPAPAKAAVFSHIASTSGFFTGLAILNPSSLTANVRILAFTPQGTLLGQNDSVLRPLQRLSKLITELIPGTANRSNGFVWVKSDIPLYTSSLFGAPKVLANVPPQQPPAEYAPDANVSGLSLTPLLAVVQPGKTQKFTASGAPGPVSWSVNGVASGNPSTGTIDSTGLYTAPPNKPAPSLITVSADSGINSGGASVDVLDKQSLISGLGVLQSIVYMQSLQRLYEVELSSAGALGAGYSASSQVTAAVQQSELYQVQPPNVKTGVEQYSDKIVKLISYPASNGKEYMLLLAQTSGQIIRLEPVSGQSRIVYTGLNQPTSMAYDSATGSVLVAESDRITQIARSFIESGLSSAAGVSGQAAPGRPTSLATVALASGATGLAIDRCTGEIYYSVASEGVIEAYDPATGTTRTLVSGLSGPGHLLALYRRGIPCPDRTQLLVAETGADRITLVAPALGVVMSWISAPGVRDLTFIPPDNPFNLGTSVAYGLFFDETGHISIVDVDDQYDTEPPVEEQPLCQAEVTFEDASLEAAVREALGLDPNEAITCEAAESLTTLDASGRNIRRIGGLEFFVNLEVLDLSHNFIRSIAPVGRLTKLQELNASYNLITSPGLSANLAQLSSLDLSYNLIEDLTTLVDLDVGSPGSPARVRARRMQQLPSLSHLDLSFNAVSDLTPLSLLTGLRYLNLSGNFSIQDLSGLSGLTGLEELNLQWNVIRDLSPLSGLENLEVLDLRHNRISHLSPLLDNPGLGEGDRIFLAYNPIDLGDCVAFEMLKDRGIEIDIDLPCDVDLAVVLSTPSSTIRFGDPVLLRSQVSNLGTADAQNPMLRLNLDPSLAIRSATGPGATCTITGNLVDCRWSSLAHGAASTVQVRAIAQKHSGVLTASATVSADQSELNTDNNSDNLTIPLAEVDLEVTKSATPSSAHTGGSLSYAINVSNHGPSEALNVTVTDQLPSGFSFETHSISSGTCSFDAESRVLDCEIPSLGADDTVVISLNGTVTSGSGELFNSATASSGENDSDSSNNTGVVTTEIVQPDLAVTKSDSVDPVTTGTALTYTVTVLNNGSGPATNVAIVDALPAGVDLISSSLPGATCTPLNTQLSCILPSLAPGANAVLTIETLVFATDGVLTNSVSATADETDANPSDNTASEETTVAQADLAVTKSASAEPAVTGADLDYVIQVTNNGPHPATGVELADILPVGTSYQGASVGFCSEVNGVVQCAVGALAAGQTVPITLTVRVDALESPISNNVSVSGDQTDPNLDNNSATVNSTVTQVTDLSLTKTGAPNPIRQGDSPTFSITVTNNGPSDATGVTVDDVIPSAFFYEEFYFPATVSPAGSGSCSYNSSLGLVTCIFPSIPSGESRIVTIPTSFAEGGGAPTIDNTATVSGNETDPDLTNNSSTFTFQQAQADLSISIVDNPDPVTQSNSLDYTVTILNAGPDSATNIYHSVFFSPDTSSDLTIDSVKPTQGTCTPYASQTFNYYYCNLGTLNPGGSIQIAVQVTPRTTSPTLTANASVDAAELDPDGSNNSAQAVTTIEPLIIP